MESIIPSYHWITPSQDIAVSIDTLMAKIKQSRAKGYHSNCTGFRVAIPAQAATPRVLKNSVPMTAPSPISDSVMKVLIMFVKNSGMAPETAIKVAAATSGVIFRSSQMHSMVGKK